jgi:late competence protein required for DNA uptake (superfamily II DNA/RNA helicase)
LKNAITATSSRPGYRIDARYFKALLSDSQTAVFHRSKQASICLYSNNWKVRGLVVIVTQMGKGRKPRPFKARNRQHIIDDFRRSKYKYLVTTAVLERGVTVKNLQVIVLKAITKYIRQGALIQIAGRGGEEKGCSRR